MPKGFTSLHKHAIILGIFVIIYFLYFTTASFLRYDNFYTGRFDLGNMDQAVWNTTQGRIFQTNGQDGEIISRHAVHADFILILLAPFYFIWEHPKTLLLIQTSILALGAVFVYAISKNVLKNKNLSLVFVFLYLFNPAMQYTNLYDFHAVTLATTFLLGAFYFLYQKRYFLFLLFALLAALTKEQIWIIIALFGLYTIFRSRIKTLSTIRLSKPQILGIATFIVSLGIFYLLIWHVIPQAREGGHFALSYYSDFGESPTNIIKNIFLSPQKTLGTFFQKEQSDYLTQLFLPLGFFSLLSPLYLVFTAPDLLINLLSSNDNLHQIYYQYSAAITPFIFISAIYGTRRLKIWFPKVSYALFAFYLLISTFYASYSYGPLPFAKKPNIDMFIKPQENKEEIESYLSQIPNSYSVAATNNAGSHLSQRQVIYTIPYGIEKADIVVFLLSDKKSQEEFEDEVKTVKSNKNYKEVYRINQSFIVFEKQ